MNTLASPLPRALGSRTRHRRQAAIGVLLAFAIVGGWLAIHVAGVFLLPVTLSTLPAMLLLAAFQTWLSVGMFIVAHDAMHGSLVPGRPEVNTAIGGALLFLYAGFGWSRMRSAHLAHHAHAGSADDPDFDPDHPRDPVRWYLTFLKRYFGLRSVVYVMAVFYTYWLALDAPLANVLLLYCAPAILSSIQLFYFGTYRPHTLNGDAFADGHHARSERFGPLVSLATCFHFGYHHEHHVDPGTPWWALPRRRRAAMREGAVR